MDSLSVYLPMDRRQALAKDAELRTNLAGAALFSDITGFTPLTEALVKELGPTRSVEELTGQLNQVYDALITQVHRFGGSVIGFVGDGITCWFTDDDGSRATACAVAMQTAMAPFAIVELPTGGTVSLTIKIGIATGPARHFVVGDPHIQKIDVITGQTLQRMALAEKYAEKAEILLDRETATTLADKLEVAEWRKVETGRYHFAVLDQLIAAVDPTPWPELSLDPINEDDDLRTWLLTPIYERLTSGQQEFLAELRSAVALFLRFEGLDYDGDDLVGEKLDAYIRWVQQTVARYEGHLIQLTIGDRGSFLYVAFGALVAHDDDPARAVAAALELQNPPPELAFISAQIGLGRGRARVGAYGSQTRRSYGVIGDEVILAHRLMMLAQAGQICCDHNTYQAAASQFIFAQQPSARVKGKKEMVQVYQPQGRREQNNEFDYFGPLPTTVMVGRQAERTILSHCIEALQQDKSHILLIEGEAGIGKSRLALELVRMLDQQGIERLMGSGHSLEQYTSYRAWRDIFSAYFALNDIDDMTERQKRVSDHLHKITSDQIESLPLLNDILNLGFPENDLTNALTPNLRQHNLTALLLTLLQAWVEEEPLVIIMEDAHWLDSLSWHLTLQVAHTLTVKQIPLLLVVVLRPIEDTSLLASPQLLAQLPHTRRVYLDTLEPEATLTLAATRLGLPDHSLPQPVAELITAKAGGNPFFAEELVYALRDQGIITRFVDESGAPQARIQGDLAEAIQTLPQTVHDMVLARIDRLPAIQQLTLKVAAVIGRTFAFPPLRHTLDEHQIIEGKTLEAQLDALIGLDLATLEIPEPELTYAFKHIITRDVAYETLLFSQRRQLHQTIAEWYERTHADDLFAFYPLLAHHWSKAEVTGQAIEYLQKSGDVAARMYANKEAVAYYRRALMLALVKFAQPTTRNEDISYEDTSPDAEAQHLLIELYTCLGQSLELDAQFGEALVNYEEMEQLAIRRAAPPMRVAALVHQGHILCTTNDKFNPERGERLSKQALGLAQTLGDQVSEIKALWNLLNLYRYTSRLDQAIECGERALPLARALNLPEQTAHLLTDLAWCYGVRGRFIPSEASFHEAISLWREVNNYPLLVDSLATSTAIHICTAEFEQAVSNAQEALQLSHKIDYTWGQSHSQFMVGYAYWEQGLINQAITSMTQSIRLSEQAGFLLPQVITRANLAAVYGSLGATGRGLEMIRQALTIAQTQSFRAEALTVLAQLHLLKGDLAEAEAQIDQSKQDAKEIVYPLFTAFGTLTEGQLLLQQGKYQEANTLADTLLADLRQSGMWVHIPATLLLKAETLLALDQIEAAREQLSEAYDAAEAIGSRRILWRILATLAQVEPDPIQAEQYHQQAQEIVTFMAEHISDPDLRQSFLALAAVPTPTNQTTLDSVIWAELQQMVGRDKALLAELIDTFLTDTPEQLAALHTAVEQKDASTLHRLAVNLKETNHDFGAVTLAGLCQQLEISSKSDNFAEVEPLIAQIEGEYLQVRRVLEARRES